jgi:hypothetical protein
MLFNPTGMSEQKVSRKSLNKFSDLYWQPWRLKLFSTGLLIAALFLFGYLMDFTRDKTWTRNLDALTSINNQVEVLIKTNPGLGEFDLNTQPKTAIEKEAKDLFQKEEAYSNYLKQHSDDGGYPAWVGFPFAILTLLFFAYIVGLWTPPWVYEYDIGQSMAEKTAPMPPRKRIDALNVVALVCTVAACTKIWSPYVFDPPADDTIGQYFRVIIDDTVKYRTVLLSLAGAALGLSLRTNWKERDLVWEEYARERMLGRKLLLHWKDLREDWTGEKESQWLEAAKKMILAHSSRHATKAWRGIEDLILTNEVSKAIHAIEEFMATDLALSDRS